MQETNSAKRHKSGWAEISHYSAVLLFDALLRILMNMIGQLGGMPVKLIKLMCSGNYSVAVAVPNRCDVHLQVTLSKPHDIDGSWSVERHLSNHSCVGENFHLVASVSAGNFNASNWTSSRLPWIHAR